MMKRGDMVWGSLNTDESSTRITERLGQTHVKVKGVPCSLLGPTDLKAK